MREQLFISRLIRNSRVGLFGWMDGWMDGVYANEGLACVQTLLSTARESQIGTRCTSLIRNFRVCLFVGMDGWSICK